VGTRFEGLEEEGAQRMELSMAAWIDRRGTSRGEGTSGEQGRWLECRRGEGIHRGAHGGDSGAVLWPEVTAPGEMLTAEEEEDDDSVGKLLAVADG
jgi:hypothetical protein